MSSIVSEFVDGEENGFEYAVVVDNGTSKVLTIGKDILETVCWSVGLEFRTAICLLDFVSNNSTLGTPGPLQSNA